MVYRDRESGYLTVSNRPLRDGALSLKAKGLFVLMVSLPPGWRYSVEGLAAICKEGRDAVRAGLWELEQAGYLRRGKNGYELFERPQREPEERQDGSCLIK